MNHSILILVCAYNEEENLKFCLNSICESIIKSGCVSEFKIVCVDNSSNDNTWSIAKRFSSSKIPYSYIKIKHCPLCVSRNTYKLYDNYDYIAYIDADGGVDINWAKNILQQINTKEPDILSGPVLPIDKSIKALTIWETFYDSNLFDIEQYLIGANMCYSASFLKAVDGFPRVFSSRGDETMLLAKANLLGLDTKITFCKDVIAYNHFSSKYLSVLKESFLDGVRSPDIIRLGQGRKRYFFNAIYRILRFSSLSIFILFIFIDIPTAIFFLLISLFLITLRRHFYIKNLLLKVRNKFNSVKLHDFIFVYFSFYLFDMGFIKSFFLKSHIPHDAVLGTSLPEVLNKDD